MLLIDCYFTFKSSIPATDTEFDSILNSEFVTKMLTGNVKYSPPLLTHLVEEQPILKLAIAEHQISGENLTKWFLLRAEEIESETWNFINAERLIEIGKDAGVLGLDLLYIDLKTLNLLVYSSGLKTFTLKELRQSKPMDILKFLLANA